MFFRSQLSVLALVTGLASGVGAVERLVPIFQLGWAYSTSGDAS